MWARKKHSLYNAQCTLTGQQSNASIAHTITITKQEDWNKKIEAWARYNDGSKATAMSCPENQLNTVSAVNSAVHLIALQ